MIQSKRKILFHKEAGKCVACNCGLLSIYVSQEQAEHAQAKYPHLGSFIAEGVLAPHHGKDKQPRTDGHTEWWPYDGVNRLKPFTRVHPRPP